MKGDSLTIEIPMLPPSVNHYVEHKAQGVHVKSAQALAWERDWPIFARGAFVQGSRFAARIGYIFGPGDSYDVDNLNKCVLDCAYKSGMLRDAKGNWLTDSRFKQMSVTIYDTKLDRPHGPKTILKIEVLE